MTARERFAEFYLLQRYDTFRTGLGHDYGCGQRGAELSRRARELERLNPDPRLGAPLTRYELAAAFERIGRKRLERALKEADVWGVTPSSRRTIAAWERVERVYALVRAAA